MALTSKNLNAINQVVADLQLFALIIAQLSNVLPLFSNFILSSFESSRPFQRKMDQRRKGPTFITQRRYRQVETS